MHSVVELASIGTHCAIYSIAAEALDLSISPYYSSSSDRSHPWFLPEPHPLGPVLRDPAELVRRPETHWNP